MWIGHISLNYAGWGASNHERRITKPMRERDHGPVSSQQLRRWILNFSNGLYRFSPGDSRHRIELGDVDRYVDTILTKWEYRREPYFSLTNFEQYIPGQVANQYSNIYARWV